MSHKKQQSSPIIVDLDGTLTLTDTLFESVIKLIRASPFSIFLMMMWIVKGRAGFKSAIASRAHIDVETLPYCDDLVEYLEKEKAKGREIILATAAHISIARKVASHFDFIDHTIASDSRNNLKGEAKLQAIKNMVGDDFVYAGDSKADIPIWEASKSAIVVNGSPGLINRLKTRKIHIEKMIAGNQGGWADWLRAFRVHQWLKNLLLFVPVLTAFDFQYQKLESLLVAFFAFSFAASATYIVNDLLDLDSDRSHPRKRNRPFASGKLSILNGLVAAAGALIVSFVMAFWVSELFLFMLVLYLMITTLYSWKLKSYVLVDVVLLSVLYTLRILAGSVAISIPVSSWLLAFSVFIFLSLALVKRCAELVSMQEHGSVAARGRDYQVSDLVILWPLGVGAGLASVVIFGLFISAPDTQERYATPELLWLVIIGLIYWLGRLWLKTARGEMHDDPLVYALKDRGSLVTLGSMVMIVLLAYFMPVEFAGLIQGYEK